MLSSSIVDAVASALDDDFTTSAEKVITLNGQPSQKMLAYSTSSYPQFKDMKAWANYHKDSGRLDSILGKCYECIRDRNNKDDFNSRRPFSINPALTSFSSPSHTNTLDAGSLAWFLNGPVAHSGGLFVSSSVAQAKNGYATTGAYNTVGGYNTMGSYSGAGVYGTASGYSGIHKIVTSLACVVGTLELDAYYVACEYGNSYCQYTVTAAAKIATCVSVCVPMTKTNKVVCTTGTLSNKLAGTCFSGSLSAGSVGAVPIVCAPLSQCQFNTGDGSVGCVTACVPTANLLCSSADYPFKGSRGPLCYVGTFGSSATVLGFLNRQIPGGAILVACGTGDNCQTVTSPTGVVTGSCSTLCTNSTTTTCSVFDLTNKQGPLCYVGRFGSTATPHACAKNQLCQRASVITPFGTTISTGSCVITCATGPNTYCCKDDLCNAYDTTLNHRKCDAHRYESSYLNKESAY